MKGNPMKTRVEEVAELCSESLTTIMQDLKDMVVQDVCASKEDALKWSTRYLEHLEQYVQYRIEHNNLTKR